ncbi:hypothetical protein SELMODRAFT_412643 [Selaginella moellendorffii]|uniref:Pentacotripeptide-repeat region of PRORP domain-containing protein n=1 Tax=Selaginella moellendorffii TaxID=88036 RepID=D8RM57_SELML|nr:pentatricopeptide repeat-containing protein At1g80270, mitochondrial [Selaginella moellendorffii]EFJ26830.1 hypothetical protein SELMODRAFT_412643 [Selaginella moellendorffii]|eukprot:XP_002971913.1 pentatricopeptide repeat-containing protein At1g80270, mitochondrial [Selaginella moellendorffii]
MWSLREAWILCRRRNAAPRFTLERNGRSILHCCSRSYLTIEETREYFPEYQSMLPDQADHLGVEHIKLLNQELKDQSRIEALLGDGEKEVEEYCQIAEPLWKKVKKLIKGVDASRNVVRVFRENELDMTKAMMRGVLFKLLRNEKYKPGWKVANYMIRSEKFELGELDYMFQIAFAALAGCDRAAENIFANLPRVYKRKKALLVLMAGSSPQRENRVVMEKLFKELKHRSWYTEASGLNQMMLFSLQPDLRKRIPDLFEEAKSLGVAPDVSSYNLYLGFHCKEKNASGLEEVYQMLQEDPNARPDESTLLILACGYISVGCFDKAGKALVELEEGLDSGLFRRKQATYNKLLRLYGDTKDKEGVENIWSILSSRPLKAVDSYSYAIAAFGKAEGVHKAEEIFAKVDGLLETNQVIAMLSVYTHYGYADKARELFQKLPRKRMKHRLVVYKYLIAGYLREGEVKKALQVFTMGCTVLRDRCICSAWERVVLDLLDHFASRGEVAVIDRIFRMNSVLKHFINMRVYRVVLKAYLNHGASLKRFMDWTMEMGFSVDAETRELLTLLQSRFRKR